MSYQIRLENFEGPFDLLFHLIEKEEIDIYDIPVARITREYLDYLANWENLDLDAASEFLLMASRLLEIKSQLLLPELRPVLGEEEGDPREVLIEQLLEYRLFRYMAALLEEIARKESKYFTSEGEKPSGERSSKGLPLTGVNLEDLVDAFRDVMKAAQEREKPSSLPGREIRKVSIATKIEELKRWLKGTGEGYSFGELLSPETSRLEIIATFLALLELIHQKKVRVYQDQVFGRIFIVPCGEW